jgi:hypothetical protein
MCNMAVFFKRDDGIDVMVGRGEDANGKTLTRDICEFNKFGDVRVCSDWDTGETIREMKNGQGEWVKVGNE